MKDPTLFSFGDCVVCSDMGALLIVKSVASKRLFLICPSCEIVLTEPPPAGGSVQEGVLKDVAPTGFCLPSEAEISSSEFDPVFVAKPTWYEYLSKHLRA